MNAKSVVIVALSQWTEYSVRVSDVVLGVANGGSAPVFIDRVIEREDKYADGFKVTVGGRLRCGERSGEFSKFSIVFYIKKSSGTNHGWRVVPNRASNLTIGEEGYILSFKIQEKNPSVVLTLSKGLKPWKIYPINSI